MKCWLQHIREGSSLCAKIKHEGKTLFWAEMKSNGLPDELLKHSVNQELLEQVEECLAWLRKEIKA
jgi:hypothetical protein